MGLYIEVVITNLLQTFELYNIFWWKFHGSRSMTPK